MTLSCKKNFLIIIFELFFCFGICPINHDDIHIQNIPVWDVNVPFFTDGNSTDCGDHTIQESTTERYESFTMHADGKDVTIETYYNYETGESLYKETVLDHENTHVFDTQLPDVIIPAEPLALKDPDYFNDFIRDQRMQEIADNQSLQKHNSMDRHASNNSKIIRELDLPKGTILYCRDLEGRVLDSTLLLNQVINIDDLVKALHLPTVQARFERLKYLYNGRVTKRGRPFKQKERTLIDLFVSGRMIELLGKIQDPQLEVAEAAFTDLKGLWSWNRDHTFLISDRVNGSTGEQGFIVDVGIDIMKIAEQALLMRQDFAAKYCDTESFKRVQDYKEQCIVLQQKGDSRTLFDEKQRLHAYVWDNFKKNEVDINICLAVAESRWQDPITNMLNYIISDKTVDQASGALKRLESHIALQAQQKNIVEEEQIREWMVKQYGYDVLKNAHNCYTSRPDYRAEQIKIHLNEFVPIWYIIENRSLPFAYIELMHFEKQIQDRFITLNIAEQHAQKEYIVNYFGMDIREFAHNAYRNRADHKELANIFIPIDVQKASVEILNNNHDCIAVAEEFNEVAQRVFSNAQHCQLYMATDIEPYIYELIESLKITNTPREFVFNVSIVDHVLTDLQDQATCIVAGKPTLLDRSPELFVRAVEKFVLGLNPYTQAQTMGALITDIAYTIGKGTSNAMCDPVATTDAIFSMPARACEYIRNVACFASDITIGKYYLSPQEYNQRVGTLKNVINKIPVEQLAQLTAENWIDIGAQLAADFVFGKGFNGVLIFLKEIDAINKGCNGVRKVASKFKKAINKNLAHNPLVVTHEGVALRMSSPALPPAGSVKEVITDSHKLLESVVSGRLSEVGREIEALKNIKAPMGFKEFKNKHIKLDFEHILGMEPSWSNRDKLKLGGFHHDLGYSVEKTGIFEFKDRSITRHGVLKSTLFCEGNFVKEVTMFPADWSRRKVVNKIYEAYDNFVVTKGVAVEKGGKYMIEGFTQEGIKVRMFITKNGVIKSAYPI